MPAFSKTKSSYYRRLFVAYLIDTGVNTVPELISETKMHRRTLQDTLKALPEIDIEIESLGGTKNTCYAVTSWGAINRKWISDNIARIKEVLK